MKMFSLRKDIYFGTGPAQTEWRSMSSVRRRVGRKPMLGSFSDYYPVFATSS
jgi:hypothetical protein